MGTRIALLAGLLFCVVSGSAAEGLSGRWISSRIDSRTGATEPSLGWAIRFDPGSRFNLEREEGFGVVATHSGTFRVRGNDLVLSIAVPTGWEPWDLTYRLETSPERLVLTGEGERITLVRSAAPHPGLAKLPAQPRTVQEAIAVLKVVVPKERLVAFSKSRPLYSAVGEHFGLALYVRNGFGLWAGNQPLCEDLQRLAPEDPDACDPDGASGVIVAGLWDDLNADIPRPTFATAPPDRYFEEVALYLRDAKRRDDNRALVFLPIWLLKDRRPDMVEKLTSTLPNLHRDEKWLSQVRCEPELILRAESLAAQEGRLTHLALLYLSECRRDARTIAILRDHLGASRLVLWPRPRATAECTTEEDRREFYVCHDDVDDYRWASATLGNLAAACMRDLGVNP